MKAPAAIFELGLNHMGDVRRAFRMVDTLLAQGATHITIQVAVDFATTTRDEASVKAVQPNCLPLEEVIAVVKHGSDKGATMGVAVLDPTHVDVLVRAGAQFFKVLSSDITYAQLHQSIARTRLPCYLSTGLATLDDITRAMELIRATVPQADIRLIHTVLQVPTPASMINLNNIPYLIEKYGVPVAYGQHSDIPDALLVATAVGAETVFVYVAEELSPDLPDGPHAVLCSDAGELLKRIAQVRTMLGLRERTLTPEEQQRRISIQRSIISSGSIQKGEVITEDMLAFKRPGTGHAPWDSAQVIGSIAGKDYVPDEDIR